MTFAFDALRNWLLGGDLTVDGKNTREPFSYSLVASLFVFENSLFDILRTWSKRKGETKNNFFHYSTSKSIASIWLRGRE